MKTCFYQEKLRKQFGNPLFLSNFFMTPPPWSKFQKQDTPPNFKGGGRKL